MDCAAWTPRLDCLCLCSQPKCASTGLPCLEFAFECATWINATHYNAQDFTWTAPPGSMQYNTAAKNLHGLHPECALTAPPAIHQTSPIPKE